MGQKTENTNLASEFYVMSLLHRLGMEPILTVGNKKSIDIIIFKNGKTLTIDVKSIAGKNGWLLGANKPVVLNNHFIILITYLDKISDINSLPLCFVIPAKELDKFIVNSKKGHVIGYTKAMLVKLEKYKEKWELLGAKKSN